MLVTDNVSGTCRSRMAVSFISCPVVIIDMLPGWCLNIESWSPFHEAVYDRTNS